MVKQFLEIVATHRLELGIILALGLVLLGILIWAISKSWARAVRMEEEDRSR